MMTTTLTSHDRRVLIAGAAIITALLLATRGVPAWYRWQRDARGHATAALLEAGYARSAASSLGRLTRARDASDKRLLGLVPALLSGDTPAAAGASLASVVGDAASASNVRIGALQVTADSGAIDGVARVSVHGDAAGDVTGIAHFLTSMEGSAPLLSVQSLSLTQSDPAAASDHPEAIRIEFLVVGLARRFGESDDDQGIQRGVQRDTGQSIPQLAPPSIPASTREVAMYDAEVLQHAADSLIANDVFRLERKPSAVAFGLPANPTPPPAAKPAIQIVLGGVMGGPPWRAVLSGIPGHNGSVIVAQGDTLGGLRVKSVQRDVVVVQGPDTMWTLKVRR
jgi:type II secretion system (T2SS) protein M